tara:strand:+ start:624 stop:926 length:303 start_codon:yes stop_codon:yes gene_type:complete
MTRINLTKKDLTNSIYMQIGFSKLVSESLIDEFFYLILLNLKKEKIVKISNFGTFILRVKNPRIGRNPKTKEKKEISKRNVVLFKPSKEFKIFINLKNNE